MNGYLWLKLGHVIAAIWMIGGVAGRQLVRAHARGTTDIGRLALLSEAAGRIDRVMVIPGNVAVVASGLSLAIAGRWPILGLLQGSDANWLFMSSLILLAGSLLVPFVYVPNGKTFAFALEGSLEAGEFTPQLLDVLETPSVKFAHRAEYVGLAVVLTLMVVKPF